MNKKEIQELIKKAQSGDEEAKLILVIMKEKYHKLLVFPLVKKMNNNFEIIKDLKNRLETIGRSL